MQPGGAGWRGGDEAWVSQPWWPLPSTFHCGRRHRGAERPGTQALVSSPVNSVTSGLIYKPELDSMLEKTLESPLDFKEIKPVHSKGNQPRIVIERTDADAPIL